MNDAKPIDVEVESKVRLREKTRIRMAEHRKRFKAKYGYSTRCNGRAGGQRERVLMRDKYACVKCGMTDTEHRLKWGIPITVDHKDGDLSDNTLANLQTLCKRCHGAKDISACLKVPRAPLYRTSIMAARGAGKSLQAIADQFGFSVQVIWKWVHRWEKTI